MVLASGGRLGREETAAMDSTAEDEIRAQLGIKADSDLQIRAIALSGSEGILPLRASKPSDSRRLRVFLQYSNPHTFTDFVGPSGSFMANILTGWAKEHCLAELYFVHLTTGCTDLIRSTKASPPTRRQDSPNISQDCKEDVGVDVGYYWCELGQVLNGNSVPNAAQSDIILDYLTNVAIKKHALAAAQPNPICRPLNEFQEKSVLDRKYKTGSERHDVRGHPFKNVPPPYPFRVWGITAAGVVLFCLSLGMGIAVIAAGSAGKVLVSVVSVSLPASLGLMWVAAYRGHEFEASLFSNGDPPERTKSK